MKKFLAIAFTFLVSSISFAVEQQEPTQQLLCTAEAVKAARALFTINTKSAVAEAKATVQIIDLDHSNGGYEVYDVIFESGEVTYSPYRVTTNIDNCVVIDFEMPFAN